MLETLLKSSIYKAFKEGVEEQIEQGLRGLEFVPTSLGEIMGREQSLGEVRILREFGRWFPDRLAELVEQAQEHEIILNTNK